MIETIRKLDILIMIVECNLIVKCQTEIYEKSKVGRWMSVVHEKGNWLPYG